VHDTALQDVRVVGGLQAAGVRVEGGSVLAEQLNVLLGVGSRLVNGLAALASALYEFLGLILDLGV
jgi:hypothetical protein